MAFVLDSPFSAIETARHLVACFNRDRESVHVDPDRAFLSVRAEGGYTVFPYGRVLYGLQVEDAIGGSTVHIVPYVNPLPGPDIERIRACIACMSRAGPRRRGERFAELCDGRGIMTDGDDPWIQT